MKKTAIVDRLVLFGRKAVPVVVAAVVVGVLTPAAMAQSPVVVPLKDARMKIELNATDNDVGIQLFIDADPWKRMDVFDPNGATVFTTVTSGRIGLQGGTELFLESAEPNFNQLSLAAFLQRFPAGDYRIQGEGFGGEILLGSARFTHNIPQGPELLSPGEGAEVDLNNTVVRWNPVPAPNGSPIVGYQVLVVNPHSGFAGIPKTILDVMMPATATSMAVPAGFLRLGTEYEWEVLAIESGGNQTLSVGHFETASISAVPEPSEAAMLALGVSLILTVARRRKNRAD